MGPHEHPITPDEDSRQQKVFYVLADSTCRRILRMTSERAMTAAELATAAEVPLSTVYRKLDRLSDTPLVERTRRLSDNGKHPDQYRSVVDRIEIKLAHTAEESVTVEASEHLLTND